MNEIPRLPMWRIELRVETPDDRVVTGVFATSVHTITSLGMAAHFEDFVDGVTRGVRKELEAKGYLE